MTSTCPACAAPLPREADRCPGCGDPVAGREPAPTVPDADVVTEAELPIGAVATMPEETPPAVDESDPFIGTYVGGKYFVVAAIAEGGMGRVYRARQPELERVVCVKRLRPELLVDPVLVARFEREAKAVSRLRHPNVVQLYDHGPDGTGSWFIAMELVPGRDLRRLVDDEAPLDEERLCRLGAQVLAALAEAHAHQVLHRDLKPENVMITPKRDGGELVKVLDFGVAKILEAGQPALTAADRVLGTPHYMSPEQARGTPLDFRSDLYSVGVILYQLATGELPFDGTQTVEVLRQHVTTPPPPFRQRVDPERISAEFEALVLRALAKRPDDRPATAGAFREELLGLAEGAAARRPPGAEAPLAPPLSLRPISLALAPPRPPDPDPLPFQADPEPPADELPPPPAHRPVRPAWVLLAFGVLALCVGALAYQTLGPALPTGAASDSCPTGMTLVEAGAAFCVDRAPLQPRRLTWKEARAACTRRSTRLCAEHEWERACRSEGRRLGDGRELEWTATVAWAGAPPRGFEDGAVPPCASTGRFADTPAPVRLAARCCADPR